MVLEIRKIYRIAVGSIFPLIYYFVSPTPIKMKEFPLVKFIPMGVALFFFLLVVILEIERYKHPKLWSYIISRPYGKILKTHPGRLLGTTYFLISTLIVIAIFSKGVAIAVLWFNILGDAISAVVGKRYGRIKFFKGKKSVEGSVSFFVICLIVGLLLCLSPRVELTVSKIVVGAVVATIVEALPLAVDDNLTIPICAGIVMELL